MHSVVRFLFGLLIVLSLVYPTHAAELGKGVFQGRTIILSDDGTWRYANPESATASGDCTTLTSEVVPFSICLSGDSWAYTDGGGESEFFLQNKQQELYMMLITEKVFIELSALKSAIVSNAQSVSGLTRVKVLEDEQTTVDGHPFGSIDYQTNIDGIDFSYRNLYSNFEGIGSMQLLFFSHREQFESAQASINQAVSAVRIDN